jgi:hypothetical protein
MGKNSPRPRLRTIQPSLIHYIRSRIYLCIQIYQGVVQSSQNKGTSDHGISPQANGQTERMNQEVKIFLRHFINHQQDDWSDWLPLAKFSIANRTTNATRVSPFLATQGQHPWTGNPIKIPDHFENESVEMFITCLSNINRSIDESSLVAQ